jgi:hypothetical protein
MRTLSKPLLNWVTYYQKTEMMKKETRLGKFIGSQFKHVGQLTNYYSTLINRRFFRLSSNSKDLEIKQLSDDKALHKGAEIVAEALVLIIGLSLPLYEMNRQYKKSQLKEQQKEKYITDMRTDVDKLVLDNEKILQNLKEIKELIKSI